MGIGLRFFHARASLMLIALAGSMSGEAAAAPPNGQPPLAVMIDHARVVKLPERTQTVIVGNPIIADVTVQRNGIMVVTGKSYGVTNLIALDGAGALLSESLISVQATSESVVTVQRGLEREFIFLHAELPAVAPARRRHEVFRRGRRTGDAAQYARDAALKAGAVCRRAVETGPFSTIDLTVPKAFFRKTSCTRPSAARDAVPGGPQRWAA